jgi:hypothetical protein
LLIGAGIAVVLIVLILIKLTSPDTTPQSTGEVSPSTSADAATSAPAATATTSAPANEPVVFRDKFSSRAAGWEGDGAVAKGAGYSGGAYRISAPPVQGGGVAGSVPTKASRVWPSAPPRIRIAVDGRRLPESDHEMSYGIACRINPKAAYVLTMGDGYASIDKVGEKYKPLKHTEPQVDPSVTNKLQAVCIGGQGREPVHLELWVNGEMVVEFTDTEAPLPPGGVGLAVGTGEVKRASVAVFDNFVVSQLA